MIEIQIPGELVSFAYATAMARWEIITERIERKKFAPKIPNKKHTHFIGRLGEVAAWHHFFTTGADPKPGFLMSESEPDITLGSGLKLEIKTWEARQWRDLGRAILMSQIQHLDRKDRIVWCSVELGKRPYTSPASAILHGWSTVSIFKNISREVLKGARTENVRSRQVEENEINPMTVGW
jgi:hypothetical protein